jgi:methylthioribose-1-phosphate isomerase
MTATDYEDGAPGDSVRPVRWRDGALELLDQRLLPVEDRRVRIDTAPAAVEAIRAMVVRGAPAIGIAAAYAVVLAARSAFATAGSDWRRTVAADIERLRHARPTAVNLSWALARMQESFPEVEGDPCPVLLEAARTVHRADVAGNRRLGELGAALLDGGGVLTHCNAGSLATGGYGTALGVIRAGRAARRIDAVYVCETRPWLQGSRLTAWELLRDGIPVTLLADGAAATLLRDGRVRWVIVGADRIAANGDVANKIGTYGLAVLARHHGVRFMVAAPVSTLDPDTPCGARIPIEQRADRELRTAGGRPVAPDGAAILNPVFDVTPAELVDVLVTDRGVVHHPDGTGIACLLDGG